MNFLLLLASAYPLQSLAPNLSPVALQSLKGLPIRQTGSPYEPALGNAFRQGRGVSDRSLCAFTKASADGKGVSDGARSKVSHPDQRYF